MKKIIRLLAIVLCLSTLLPTMTFAQNNTINNEGYTKITINQLLNTVEETVIVLPESFTTEIIDGVSIELNGKLVNANININKNILTISPFEYEYFKDEKTYTIRLFTRNNKRYEFNVKATNLAKLDFTQDNLIKIPANPDKGFNYPYWLFVPRGANVSDYKRLVVEPNNTGRVSDFLQIHDREARICAIGASQGAHASEWLKIPLLVPVFPRPETDWWDNYYHTLSRDVMLQKSGDGKRVDLQLIAMIKDAQELLAKNGLKLEEKVFMTGFSASGQFVNRFTVLHPEMVKAVFHGGFTMYPTDTLNGNKLTFPLGIADIEEIAGKSFNVEEYKKVAQFVYTGDLDRNDRIEPSADDYSEYDAQVMYDLYQSHDPMIIWKKKEQYMNQLGFGESIQFHIYKGIGHSIPRAVYHDVINFFISNNGDNIVKINATEDSSYWNYDATLQLLNKNKSGYVDTLSLTNTSTEKANNTKTSTIIQSATTQTVKGEISKAQIEKNIDWMVENLGFQKTTSTSAMYNPINESIHGSVISVGTDPRNIFEASIIFRGWIPDKYLPENEKVRPIAKELFNFYFPTKGDEFFELVDSLYDGKNLDYMKKILYFDNRAVYMSTTAGTNYLRIYIGPVGRQIRLNMDAMSFEIVK